MAAILQVEAMAGRIVYDEAFTGGIAYYELVPWATIDEVVDRLRNL